MGSAKLEHLVFHKRKVRRNDKLESPAVRSVHFLRLQDDLTDQREIQQGLSPLELDFERWGRRSKNQIQGLLGGFRRHVERKLVVALARDLTIRTGVLAPQRNHEYMKARKVGQSSQLRSYLQGE